MKRKLTTVITILSLLLIAEIIFICFSKSTQLNGPGGLSEVGEPAAGGSDDRPTGAGTKAGQAADYEGSDGMDAALRDDGLRDADSIEEDSDDTAATDKGEPAINADDANPADDAVSLINEDGTTARERIVPPEGFERLSLDEDSFGEYLRNLPLKPHGSSVRYYDGGTKPWDVHVAVIDMDVGTRDLQQCADAVIRLRAEYLHANGRYDEIHFNFTNGFNAKYSKWIQGYRVSITGNKAVWVENGSKGTDYKSFRKYLDTVFAYAGTLSLSQEMKKIDLKDMQPGDVFLKGGSPGHCVIITDMAENPLTGERVFLTAQSYMPAQDIHILKNPANEDGNPWYPVEFGDELVTPEWTFSKDQIYRFAE